MKVVIKVENTCNVADVLKNIAEAVEVMSTDYPDTVKSEDVEVVIDGFDANYLYE